MSLKWLINQVLSNYQLKWFNMVLIVCIVSLSRRGYKPSFRLTEQGDRFVTDMKNYIIDLDLGKIENPVALGEELKAMTGVVDHGLFNGMVNKVIVAGKDGVKVVEVKAQSDFYSPHF